MSNRRVQVVVLCEGLEDFRFAYKCLVTSGWRPDQIASKISPRGSGFSFVLDSYPAEVHANRQGKKRERALFVLVDADSQPAGGRENELAKRLQVANQSPRQSSERIAHWIPRRQLETWVYFLTQGPADETAEYKKTYQVKEDDYLPAAKRLARILHERRSLPPKAVPSLKKAVGEFDRLRAKRSKQSTRV